MTAPVFSRPIAALRVGQETVVAGFVAHERSIRVVGLRGSDPPWTTDALRDVASAPDAEISILPAAKGGVAVWWRSPGPGRRAGALVILGPAGELLRGPIDVGGAVCATDSGLAWLSPDEGGPHHVFALAWGDAGAHDVMTVPTDRAASLVCGDRVAFVVIDSDEDVKVSSLRPAEATLGPPVIVERAGDFPDDDLDRETVAIADDLEIVHLSSAGEAAIRRVSPAGATTAWRKLRHRFSADEDLVMVDGDARELRVLSTREGEAECPESRGPGVALALFRFERGSGTESSVPLAPAACDWTPGSPWMASPSEAGTVVVAWAERRADAPRGSAITGLSYRVLGPGALQGGRIDLDADEVVDGACDDRVCFAAALVRPPVDDRSNGDGAAPAPESIAVLQFP
jgi:hypothetical protein